MTSDKNALAFLARLENDASLRQELGQIAGSLDLGPLVQLARDKGYACDEQSMRAAWHKRRMLKEVVARTRRS